MWDARRPTFLLLLAGLTIELQKCRAQWRPSYQPSSAVYNIHDDTFTITLAYNQWQGYFLNTYTVPAGGPFQPCLHLQLHVKPHVVRPNSTASVPSARCMAHQACDRGMLGSTSRS